MALLTIRNLTVKFATATGSFTAVDGIDVSVDRGEVLAIDTTNCLIRTDGVRVAAVGVQDLIVVASGEDILILPRGRSQDVKKLIEAMKR